MSQPTHQFNENSPNSRGILGLIRSLSTDAARGFQLFAVVRQASALLVGVLLAKSILTLHDIGIYEMWMYVGLFLTFLCLSGSLQALGVLFNKWTAQEQAQGLWQVYFVIWLICGAIAAILLLLKAWLVPLLFQLPELPRLSTVLLYLILHLTAAMIPQVFLLKNKARSFVPFAFLFLLGQVIPIIWFMVAGGGLDTIINGYLIVGLAEQVYLLYLLRSTGQCSFRLHLAPRFLKIALPLILLAGMGVAAQLFDAWLVNWWYQDPSVFAVFRYGARELPGSLALASAFTMAMVVLYTKDRAATLIRIKEGTTRAVHIVFPIAIVLVWFSRPLFGWVYSPEFYESAIIFNTYLLIGISRWVFPHVLLIAEEKHSVLLKISIVELCLNVILSIVLIQYFGLMGVAMGTVIAFILEKVFFIIYLSRKEDVPLSTYVPIRMYLFYSVLLLAVYFIQIYY